MMARELDSMYQQAVRVASMIDNTTTASQLEEVLR